MFNLREEAEESKRLIFEQIQAKIQADKDKSIKADVAYKTSESILFQLFNVATQKGIDRWIERQFGMKCQALRDLGLHFAKDQEIYDAARKEKAILVSKDSDFRDMVLAYGPPPQILWVTCGNTSTARMQEIFSKSFLKAVEHLKSGEALVEITDRK